MTGQFLSHDLALTMEVPLDVITGEDDCCKIE